MILHKCFTFPIVDFPTDGAPKVFSIIPVPVSTAKYDTRRIIFRHWQEHGDGSGS